MRLHDYLNFNARETPADEFACDGRRTVTNAEAAAEANQIANAFVSAGIQVGDRVAILSKNSVEYAILYFGASAAGAVPVPLNYRLAPAEWSYIINDAGARMMIAKPPTPVIAESRMIPISIRCIPAERQVIRRVRFSNSVRSRRTLPRS